MTSVQERSSSTSAAERAVVLEGVSKQFGEHRAVSDMNLIVPRGCVYGFLGPNGAGKTTTIRMILSIFEPSEGRVEILGHRSALEVRNRIGYLPEEKGLYRKMKAWAVIAYFGALKGMSHASAKARAIELLREYGLGDFVNHKCDQLSKGMQQKVQLLASIVHDPELVILDEPFSGLDPVNQEVMEGAIRSLKNSGRTVIFSTHIMEHAERLCDRIVLIAKGRRVFDGTVDEAKRSVPRRVRIGVDGSPDALQRVPSIRSVRPAEGAPNLLEVDLAPGADPDSLLRTCFESGVVLRSFDRSDPTLLDVFKALVKAQGAGALTQ